MEFQPSESKFGSYSQQKTVSKKQKLHAWGIELPHNVYMTHPCASLSANTSGAQVSCVLRRRMCVHVLV